MNDTFLTDDNLFINSIPNYNKKKSPFNILIAYNSEKKEYEINNDIEELTEDFQNIIKSTINIINENIKKEQIFKYDLYNFLHIFFNIIIILLYSYISFIICVLLLINPMIIIFIIIGYIKLFFFLSYLNESIKEKKIMKNVKNSLNEANENEININKTIKWKFGRGGTWIEINIEKPTRKI